MFCCTCQLYDTPPIPPALLSHCHAIHVNWRSPQSLRWLTVTICVKWLTGESQEWHTLIHCADYLLNNRAEMTNTRVASATDNRGNRKVMHGSPCNLSMTQQWRTLREVRYRGWDIQSRALIHPQKWGGHDHFVKTFTCLLCGNIKFNGSILR